MSNTFLVSDAQLPKAKEERYDRNSGSVQIDNPVVHVHVYE